MLIQLILMILDTICGLLTMALLARFALQAVRVSFRNPLGQFVIAITDWMVRPARRFIPSAFGHDLPSLVLAWFWQAVYLGIAMGFTGALITVSPAPTIAIALIAVLETVKISLYLAMGVVIVSAVFSWVNPQAPLADLFDYLSRPLLRPFRRFIPPVGGVDLSPLALLLALQVALFILSGLRQSVMPLLYS
jgi:YggT family protein